MKKGKIIIPSVIMMALCAIISFVIHFSAPFVPSELSADGALSYVIEVEMPTICQIRQMLYLSGCIHSTRYSEHNMNSIPLGV